AGKEKNQRYSYLVCITKKYCRNKHALQQKWKAGKSGKKAQRVESRTRCRLYSIRALLVTISMKRKRATEIARMAKRITATKMTEQVATLCQTRCATRYEAVLVLEV